MQAYRILIAALGMAGVLTAAHASPKAATITFAVMRNGAQIGTNLIRVERDGPATTVQAVTHVEVGLGFVTLYKYDQTETERWANGRLVAMTSTTDDNGTTHNASAQAGDGKIVVHADQQVRETAATAIPLTLWNASVVDRDLALDPKDGSVQPLKVFDRGEEQLVVQGRRRPAHHYEIVTKFPQDVWYDDNRQLVQVELKGSDGSTIRYQLM
jgi:hypothetical protein